MVVTHDRPGGRQTAHLARAHESTGQKCMLDTVTALERSPSSMSMAPVPAT